MTFRVLRQAQDGCRDGDVEPLRNREPLAELMEMTENKIFRFTFLASLLIHAVLLSWLSMHNPCLVKEAARSIEITYQPLKAVTTEKNETRMKPPSENSPARRIPHETKILEGKEMGPGAKAFVKDSSEGPPLFKELVKFSGQWQMDKSRSARIETRPVERKITVPELKSEKINNPQYVSYYQIVRGKIKERAYRNYSRTDKGEVYLTFVLGSDGSLKEIKLIDAKTSAGEYLKEIGLKSIKESNPFPSFPADLNYPELSFNVVISFELKD